MRSGEGAQAPGGQQQTLRYYERRGLLAEPPRTAGGHRIYPPETLIRLRTIKAAQRLGLSLREAGRLAEVESTIAELQLVATTLRATLAAGCTDLVECAGVPHCPVPFSRT